MDKKIWAAIYRSMFHHPRKLIPPKKLGHGINFRRPVASFRRARSTLPKGQRSFAVQE